LTNLIRFGQNQNLAPPKTSVLLRLWIRYFIKFSVLNPESWSDAVSKTVGLTLIKEYITSMRR